MKQSPLPKPKELTLDSEILEKKSVNNLLSFCEHRPKYNDIC